MNEPFWIAFGILLVLDLIVTAVRSSLLNTRLPHLLNLREAHPGEVDRTVVLLERPRLRASLRLASTVVHIASAGIGLGLVLQTPETGHSLGLVLGVLAGLAFILLLGEFAIEGWVLRTPEEVALRLAPIGRLFNFILTPFSIPLVILWGQNRSPANNSTTVTEDALRTWVEAEQPLGGLDKGEREMIFSIFQFGDTLVREIMIPRIDIQTLDISTNMTDVIDLLTSSGHSRVPIYEETIDNIVGLLYAKDLLHEGYNSGTLIAFRHILRPAYFVPEAKKVDELLTEMQSRRVHMAVVVDEYGGVAGLVTLEDIMEEIVGEIRDEYDQQEELPYQQVGPDEYIFQGRMGLEDFNQVMGAHLPKDVADTLAGFIYGQMGRVPMGGEQVEVDDLILVVEEVIGRRIRKVRALRPKLEGKKEEEDHVDR